MAFKFTKTKYSPIELGELGSFAPTMTVERRLRVQTAKFDTPENALEAIKVMAACFDEHAEEVEKFFQDVDILQCYKLQGYLIGGDAVLEEANALDELYKKG